MGFGKLEWKLSAIGFALLIFSEPYVFAAAPVQVTYPNNGLRIPFYSYGESGNCLTSCLRFSPSLVGGYHDAASYLTNWANFTNFALGAASNPAQSFSVGLNRMNASLNQISSNGIEFVVYSITTFTLNLPSITTFVPAMHVQTNLGTVPEVDVTAGSLKTPIQSGSYVTTAAAFASCSAPCVFSNPSNRTVVVKTPTTMPQTVDILVIANPVNTNPSLLPVFAVAGLLVIFIGIFALRRRRRR